MQERRVGDMGGADTVAVGDGGEPLDRRAEQAPERLRFRLAKLRKLRRHMSDGAVVLTQLLAAAGRRDPRGRGVPIGRERLGERVDALGRRQGLDHHPVAPFQVRHLLASEFGDGLLAVGPGEEAKRAAREIVVRVLERVPARIGNGEKLGRASPATVTVSPGLLHLDHAVAEQAIEMPPNRGWGETQPAAEREGGDGTVFEYEPGNPGPRAPFTGCANPGGRPPGTPERCTCQLVAIGGSAHRAAGHTRRLNALFVLPHVFHNISVA
jgi:hypothetical protein